MTFKEYLEVIGGMILILSFISPVIFILIKAKIMPSVQSAIRRSIEEKSKENEEHIIKIVSDYNDKIVKEIQEKDDREIKLRSENFINKIDSLRYIFERNEADRQRENQMVCDVLDSLKLEVVNLSKVMVEHQSKIMQNQEDIREIKRKI